MVHKKWDLYSPYNPFKMKSNIVYQVFSASRFSDSQNVEWEIKFTQIKFSLFQSLSENTIHNCLNNEVRENKFLNCHS